MADKQYNFKDAKGARAGKDPKARRRGRPFGKLQKTLEREKVAEAVNQRIYRIADGLINAQASVASGIQILMRIDKHTTAAGRVIEEKAVVVTDAEEIKAYIDSLHGGEQVNDESVYYYITTEKPLSQAIDSLVNRALGKPKETMEIQGATKLKVDF